MKTLLLFHRLELADFYTELAKHLENSANVIHLAYSEDEEKKLKSLGVDSPIFNFKSLLTELWPACEFIDHDLIRRIDAEIISYTNGAFCLNGVIQSDRGFVHLSYDESLRLASAYYLFWTKFYKDHNVDFILHETPSLTFNFFAAMILGLRGGEYLFLNMLSVSKNEIDFLIMSGFEFNCHDINRHYEQVVGGELKVDIDECQAIAEKFRSDMSIFLGDTIGRRVSYSKIILRAFYSLIKLLVRARKYDRVLDNIDYWGLRQNLAAQKLKNIINYKRHVNFIDFDSSEKFFFYPFQLEPEAGINYQSHGIYMHQHKLIQNIAAQLPAGTFLYVKDHPHAFGYRDSYHYEAIQHIPNVKLLAHDIPAKQVIRHAEAVVTITGTAGFEGLMLGKHVFILGKTFYMNAPKVHYVEHVRGLRQAIYENISEKFSDEADLFPFLTALLMARNSGLTDYYGGRAKKYGIDLDLNARKVASALRERMYV